MPIDKVRSAIDNPESVSLYKITDTNTLRGLSENFVLASSISDYLKYKGADISDEEIINVLKLAPRLDPASGLYLAAHIIKFSIDPIEDIERKKNLVTLDEFGNCFEGLGSYLEDHE